MKTTTISLLILLILSACDYSSDEIYFVEVDLSDLPELEISSSLDTMESVLITDSLLFEYEISIDTGKIFYTQIFFDESFIFASDSLANSVWINPDTSYNDGHYDIYMEVIYKSSTGSLADRINAEYLLKDTSWVVTLNRGDVLL